jgi:hypothetical protein
VRFLVDVFSPDKNHTFTSTQSQPLAQPSGSPDQNSNISTGGRNSATGAAVPGTTANRRRDVLADALASLLQI